MSGLGRGSRKRGENHRACSLLHYRAIDQFGQVIDVLVAEKRDLAATRRFFTTRGCSTSWCLPPAISPSNTEAQATPLRTQ